MIHYTTLFEQVINKQLLALQRGNFDYDIFNKSERQKTLLHDILGSIGAATLMVGRSNL